MDYCSRYGLEFNPFLKNSKETIVETTEYKELCYRLDYLTNTKGFGLLTGGSGQGKTTAVRTFARGLSPSLFKIIYISLSTLTTNEFYKHMAEELGLDSRHKKSDNFKMIQEEINRYALEKRITPFFIIDEANSIQNGILNDLKMLFNFSMDSKDRAIILLIGLPQLNNTLRLVSNEPLRQRMIMNYHLDNLSKEETKHYILKKLQAANGNVDIFNENALEAIGNSANGIPRIINKICNSALFIGNAKKVAVIDNDIIMSAVNDVEI